MRATGVRGLGLQLAKERPERINLFLTHTHFDHVCGIPFFQPAYVKESAVHFYAGHLPKSTSLRDVLCQMMRRRCSRSRSMSFRPATITISNAPSRSRSAR